MNDEQFTELAIRYQAGEEGAAEQLLRLAFVPVAYQCGRILQDDTEAETLAGQILAELSEKLPSLSNPANFRKWMQHLIASRCAEALVRRRWEEPDAEHVMQMPGISGALLDDEHTACAVADMVAALPDDERLCTFLHCCGGMSLQAISRGIDMDEDGVRRNLDGAQAAVRQRLTELRSAGVKLLGLGSLSMLLNAAMVASVNPEDADELLFGSSEPEEGENAPEPEPTEEKPQKGGKGWLIAFLILLLLNALTLYGVYLQL